MLQAVVAVADIALDIQLAVEEQHRDIEIAVSKRRKYMAMAIEKSTTPLPEYPGPYSVAPRFYYGHTLQTAGKQMAQNVTVEPIAIYEVSNPQGGRTITIGQV